MWINRQGIREEEISKEWHEPQRFPQFLDKMGKMLSEDYDWSADIAKLPMPELLVFADNDSVSRDTSRSSSHCWAAG